MLRRKLPMVRTSVLLCGLAVLCSVLCSLEGCARHGQRQERAPEGELQRMLSERVIVASLLDCKPSQVACYNDPAECVPGGDRGWRVTLGGKWAHDVVTKRGRPVMIDGLLPMPQDLQLPPKQEREAMAWEDLPGDDQAPARIACYVVAKMFGLVNVTDDYVEVKEVRRLQDSDGQPSKMYVVIVSFPEGPWSEIWSIDVLVDTGREGVSRMTFMPQ